MNAPWFKRKGSKTEARQSGFQLIGLPSSAPSDSRMIPQHADHAQRTLDCCFTFFPCRGVVDHCSVAMLLCAAAIALLASVCGAHGGATIDFHASNVETVIYDQNLEPVAALKIERVYMDCRRLGFFRVRSLPVLVCQGVRVELSQGVPNTNWLATFDFKPALGGNSGSAEWRDFSVSVPDEVTPRLRAKLLSPGSSETGVKFCKLEEVTLRTPEGPLIVPRARLMLDGSGGRVVWESGGLTHEWNLFTSNVISQKAENPQDNPRKQL
jgi:hypothetical protein